MGAVRMAFRAKLRHRWRSWLAIAILISVVGGVVLAAVAAGRRTEAAFPQFVVAHGFDTAAYATQPVPAMSKFPGVISATELIGLDSGQPTCDCTQPIDPTDFGVLVAPPKGRSPLKLVSGRLPDPSAPDQVLASFTFQQDYGVHLGSEIRVPFYALSQASAYNNATGARPKPRGPTIALRVVGFEATEFEFPAGTAPSYDLYTTPAFARTVLPRTAANYVYLVRLRGGANGFSRFDVAASAAGLGGQNEDQAATRHRNLHPSPGHRVVDPGCARRSRRIGGRRPGPSPSKHRRERGLPHHGCPGREPPPVGGPQHGAEPGGGDCRCCRSDGGGHRSLADRPSRRGACRRELYGYRL